MNKMNAFDWAAYILLVVGGLNWGLVGFAKYDLVAAIFGKTFGELTVATEVIYALVGLAALYMILKAFMKPKSNEPSQPAM